MLHSQRNETSGKIFLNLFTRTSVISLSSGYHLPVCLVGFLSEGRKGDIGNNVIGNMLKYVQQWSGKGEAERTWEEAEDSFCYYLLSAFYPFLLDYKWTTVVESCKQQCKIAAHLLLCGLWDFL